MIILSILCPTIPSRKKQFEDLRYKIVRQIGAMNIDHPSLGHVQFISDDSKPFLEGGLSIGAKCNALLKRAEGKYVCYLHDDDNVSPNYVETLVRLCRHGADVVTFRNITMLDTFWTTVDMSLYYPNDQASPMFEIRRKPWNICPVKSEFAKLVQYPDTSYGEDADWMTEVLKYCTTEAKTNAVLHQYSHSKHSSEADKIVEFNEREFHEACCYESNTVDKTDQSIKKNADKDNYDMKPLIIFHLNSCDGLDTVKYLEEALSRECEKGGSLDGYSCIVIHGDMEISVHYPHKPLRYYYNKIKTWVILKIWKRKIFSNTSVTL